MNVKYYLSETDAKQSGGDMIEDNALQLSCHVCIIQCLLILLDKHCILIVSEGVKT